MSEALPDDELNVDWSIPDPPILASSWKSWDAHTRPLPHRLDARLGWPEGTVHVLENAFKKQLGRTIGWDLTTLDKASIQAFEKAAQVFRRGVAVLGKSGVSRQGHYSIRLVPSWTWDLPRLSRDLMIIDARVMHSWKIPEAPHIVPLALSESSKTLETVAQLLEIGHAKAKEGWDGSWVIIGGGIMADTAAFAASLQLKPFRLVPTTLLAMLDACVGGKTGVNFPPFGKNQVGLFGFPTEVIVAHSWLKTLPKREWLAGLCEGYKHALLIGDPHLASSLCELELNSPELIKHLKRLIQLKVDIVMKDPSERGVRATLNLGHTLAHAIERVSHINRPDHPILHGEAVGIGLLFCLELSLFLGHLTPKIYNSMRVALLRSNLLIKPRQLLKYLGYADLASNELIEELLIGIKQDKKARSSDGSDWILLSDWGVVVEQGERFTVSIFDDDFRLAYRQFIKSWIS